MQMQGGFNATGIKPQYSVGGAHPVGMFEFQITNTTIKPTKDNPDKAGFLEVELTSPVGKMIDRFNLWNPNAQAVEIAQKQLASYCHATGIFQLNYPTQCAELRGAYIKAEVGYQRGEEPTSAKPDGGYVEIKKVFDRAGNEPGKAPSGAPQPQQGQQGWNQPQGQQQPVPMQQSPSGGWQQGPAQNNAPQGNSGGWQGGGQQVNPPQNPSPNQNNQSGNWNQGGNSNAPNAPPWGQR